MEISLFRAKTGNAAAELPTIVSVEPKQISSEGGDTVSIFGTSLDSFPEPSSAVYVQFGSNQTVVGSVTDGTTLVCRAPSTTWSNSLSESVQDYFVLVRVTNLVNFWSNAVQLFVETPTQALSIFPNAGPSCGGTSVSVIGRNFRPSFSMACVFGESDGNVTAPATWRSPDLVECVSPPWLLLDGEHSVDVPFVLSASGNPSQQSPLSFRFATPIAIATVWPEVGPAEGGTNVTVGGVHLSGYDLMCIIGGQEVSPAVQGDGHVQCTLPARGSPPDRTFKINVVERVGSSGSYDAPEWYQLVNADAITVREAIDSIDQARLGLPSGAIVLPLVRGRQYWLDQTDDSNFGHPVAFFCDAMGTHVRQGKPWIKGVRRFAPLSGSSAYGGNGSSGTGEGVVSFVVPTDAPDVLYMYSETSSGLESDIVAIITDEVVHTSVAVVAAHGAACNPAARPFRYCRTLVVSVFLVADRARNSRLE